MGLTVDLNGICNIGCEFCYQNLDGSTLSERAIYKITDESEFDTVEIGGGEPLIDKRIIPIIKGIREKGKSVHISTNATFIPEGVLDLEDKIRKGTTVQVSLHASNPKLYEEITGRNLFNNVIKNIGRIKPKYDTVMSSVVYQRNLDDVQNLVGLAEELELPLRINLVFPIGNGKNVKLLTQKQIDQLRGYLLVERIKRGSMIDSPLIHESNCTALEKGYGIEKKGLCPVDCDMKRYVSPRGEVYDCEFLQERLLEIEGTR